MNKCTHSGVQAPELMTESRAHALTRPAPRTSPAIITVGRVRSLVERGAREQCAGAPQCYLAFIPHGNGADGDTRPEVINHVGDKGGVGVGGGGPVRLDELDEGKEEYKA